MPYADRVARMLKQKGSLLPVQRLQVAPIRPAHGIPVTSVIAIERMGTGVPAQPHLLGRRRVAEHRSLSTARHDVDTKIYRRLTCVPDRLHSCQGAPPVRIVRTLVYRNGYRQPENLDWKYWRNRCGGSTSRTAMTPMQATFTAQLGV